MYPTRQAADASVRLTVSNYKGGSLLKQVGGQLTSSSPVLNASRDGDVGTRTRQSVSPTNALPEGSSDEDEPSPAQTKTETPPRPKRYGQNLRTPREKEQVLEKAEAESSKRQASSSPLRNSQPKSEGDTESKALSGTSAKAEPEDENNEPDWLSQSQRLLKKQKMNSYGRNRLSNIYTARKPQTGSQPDLTSQEMRPRPSSGFINPGYEDLALDEVETKVGTTKPAAGFLQPRDVRLPSEKSHASKGPDF